MSAIIKTLLLQACAAFALLPAAAAADYSDLAGRIAKAAAANGITRVALASFSALSAPSSEAEYARERTAAGLSSARELVVLDQEALEGYGGPKAWSKLPSRERPQAFVKGALFQAGEEVTLLVKLVDAASGRVLETGELRSFSRSGALPPVPDIDWNSPPATAKVDGGFRDAPADDGFNCAAAFKQMGRINSAAVDLKARYWAAKMKEPGFVLGSLSRNPGSEIRDRGVREKFYALLADYHEKAGAPTLPEAQLKKLEEFMGRESDVIDRCGSR
ncbi:MAG: hypothetical protein M0025_03655 [Elusimicrobia bacterium]|nr:hypothetical protein [Elusimicrobiota bacterium]